ncbi:MAG TPA: DUF29 domain-containing protein [Candidatus Binataceae bacterium]|nr:DUF29 domain-containing protein [Candidatus Binataceae bacterium]
MAAAPKILRTVQDSFDQKSLADQLSAQQQIELPLLTDVHGAPATMAQAVVANVPRSGVVSTEANVEEPNMTSVERTTDSYAWLRAQAAALEAGNLGVVDQKGLAEELEDMAAIQRGTVVSMLRVLITHLLKWRYSAVKRGERSWQKSMLNARLELQTLLGDSRQLRNEFDDLVIKSYTQARRVAGLDMQLEKAKWERLFPVECEWTRDQLLDLDFIPTRSDTADHNK